MTRTLNNLLYVIFLHSTLLAHISEQSPLVGDTVQIVENDEFRKDYTFIGSIGDFRKLGVHKKLKSHYCGGVLISKRHVLTAGHCLKPRNFRSTMVTFGSTDLDHGLSYELKSWITYRGWAIRRELYLSDVQNYHDIAVITLSSDVNGIEPAAISNLTDHEVFGKDVIAIGWGSTDVEIIKHPLKLHKAYSRVLNTTDCEMNLLRLSGPWEILQPNEYCTQTKPPMILTCGDSGGPLLLKSTKEIVGINRAVCGSKRSRNIRHSISIHVKVRVYQDFINDVVNGL